ncbi:MAG: hypothetical protein HYY93_08045 [Planctomycetes bacterium]|nr:hypothetical protein [Planctomycetota bacterium]
MGEQSLAPGVMVYGRESVAAVKASGGRFVRGEAMRERRLTLIEVMVVVLVILVLAALLLPFIPKAHPHDDGRYGCMTHFKQLGVSLALYVDRFGRGKSYPPASGAAFWNTLRTVPTRATSMLPDNDDLFVCRTKGGSPSATRIDYTGPRSSWFPPANPQTATGRIIAADLPTNHDPAGKGDINVLFFDGHVETAQYGSALWDQAARDTEP